MLEYLVGFQTLCRTLNVSEAATELGITQSALSKQLKRLEDNLGVALFVRQQRVCVGTSPRIGKLIAIGKREFAFYRPS